MLKISKPDISLEKEITDYIESIKPFKGGEWDDTNKNIKQFKCIVKTKMKANKNESKQK